MRLLKVKLSGIRRFESATSLRVEERLVAVVGPNEAGKTSLLDAIARISKSNDSLPGSIGTRQSSASPEVCAWFELEEGDKEALAGVHDAVELDRFWLYLTEQGKKWVLQREPRRDLTSRLKVGKVLGELIETSSENRDWESDWLAPLAAKIQDAILVSEDSVDTLEPDQVTVFRQVLKGLESVADSQEEVIDESHGEGASESTGPPSPSDLAIWTTAAEILRDAIDGETEEAPRTAAIKTLQQRLPEMIVFDEEHRDLRYEYDLREINVSSPPAALENLASLANLELSELQNAIEAGDHGTARLLRENANKVLQEEFERSYGQSDVCIQIETEGHLLRLLVHAEGGEDFIELTQRSAGFQWFVALVAFLARRQNRYPILLIDEIETHLHYEAQADLIDVLSRQEIAQQVIYTTHSAGALPPDLGRGVRAVVPVTGRQRSRIDNAFWTSGPGFTPLLFGLGATTLPFSIPRYLVVAEGPSDAILLPTLLRESTGLAELPYRIAPGIANTSSRHFHKLESEGGKVAYLVDNDKSGQDYREQLVKAGIDSSRIFTVGLDDSVVSPEDLVTVQSYLTAVNAEGSASWTGEELQEADIGDFGRAKKVEDWCKAKDLGLPSKVAIAQRLVSLTWVACDELTSSQAGPNPTTILASEQAGKWLLNLHEKLLAVLGIDE